MEPWFSCEFRLVSRIKATVIDGTLFWQEDSASFQCQRCSVWKFLLSPSRKWDYLFADVDSIEERLFLLLRAVSAFDGANFLKMVEVALKVLESLNFLGTWIIQ